MSNLKKLSLYGNLVEDEGAIAIAESKFLLKLKHLFITSNRIRREGIEALKKAKCRTRLCHLHVDDLKDFFYEEEQDYDDTDLINSWEELKARSAEKADFEED
jgi:Ran GTPase-activating protein (RanGAP) involved in mRNA processing and transport